MNRLKRRVTGAYFSALVGETAAARLLGRAGLLEDGDIPASLDLVTFWRLCAENIQAANDESHGLAAQPVPRGSLSVLISAAKEADDLMGALERFAEAARLVRKECRVSLGKGRETVRLTVRPADNASVRAEIYCECFLIVAHCALRWMTGRPLTPVVMRGSSALRPFGGAVMLAAGPHLVRRGEGATFVYRREDMAAPVLTQKYTAWGEAEFAAFVAMLGEDQPEAPPEAPEVEAVISALRAGLRSQSEVAAALGASVATLRRRLAEAGVCFRQLSAGVRQAELQELLATELPMQAIAERLGLADDRSLRRFCTDRLGVSPRQYRRLSA